MEVQFPYASNTAIAAAAIDDRLTLLQPGRAPLTSGCLRSLAVFFDGAVASDVELWLCPGPQAARRAFGWMAKLTHLGSNHYVLAAQGSERWVFTARPKRATDAEGGGESNLFLVVSNAGAATVYSWLAGVASE